MSTLSSVNVTNVNLVLKERTHMRLCINMLIFTHNLGNWPISDSVSVVNINAQELLVVLHFDAAGFSYRFNYILELCSFCRAPINVSSDLKFGQLLLLLLYMHRLE